MLLFLQISVSEKGGKILLTSLKICKIDFNPCYKGVFHARDYKLAAILQIFLVCTIKNWGICHKKNLTCQPLLKNY